MSKLTLSKESFHVNNNSSERKMSVSDSKEEDWCNIFTL